ncbi:MAG: exosortase/archaeosortase family protein [Thermoguttaceae bacterium]
MRHKVELGQKQARVRTQPETVPQAAAGVLAPAGQSLGEAVKEGWQRLAAVGGLLAVVFAWAYWPTLCNLVKSWNTVADYSHGFFVAPLAVYFLWARRDRFPAEAGGLAWPGLLLLLLALVMRFAGARYFISALEGWSILLWVAGTVWALCGSRVLWWSLPSVGFLWFMIPLPFGLELGLSLPLQTIATHISCWFLQMLGQPALAEGHTIILGEHALEVEQACSGLRIFMGIVALAFAYVAIVRRPWWEKAVLLASVVPIALVANATRVVITGLLYQYVSGEAGQKFTHDAAGWVMILFAAGLFALVLWYLGKLVREVEVVEVDSVVRRERV